MKKDEYVLKRISEAEKRIKELLDNGDLKKLEEDQRLEISKFYEQKSLMRLATAKLIFENSKQKTEYSDYSEVVSAGYYSMYYIVHSFIALKYQRKLRENVRGVHAITLHLILYYLVKTEQLSKFLYEEYCRALETAAGVDHFLAEDFQKEAFGYAERYEQERTKREKFTYFVSENAEEHHAKISLDFAEEFVNTIRQLML